MIKRSSQFNKNVSHGRLGSTYKTLIYNVIPHLQNNYTGFSSASEYVSFLSDKNDRELHYHASQVGVLPITDRVKLTEDLVGQYNFFLSKGNSNG